MPLVIALGLLVIPVAPPIDAVATDQSSTSAGIFRLTSVQTAAFPPGFSGDVGDGPINPTGRYPRYPRATPAVVGSGARFEAIAHADLVQAFDVDNGCATVAGRLACWGVPGLGANVPTPIADDQGEILGVRSLVVSGSARDWIACAAGLGFITCAGTQIAGGWKKVSTEATSKVVASPRNVCALQGGVVRCAATTNLSGVWSVMGNETGVVDVAISTNSPMANFAETLCLATIEIIKCRESEPGAPAEFKVLVGPDVVERIWLLNTEFQGIQSLCAYSRGFLWCDSLFRKTNGLTSVLFPIMPISDPLSVVMVGFNSSLGSEMSGRYVVGRAGLFKLTDFNGTFGKNRGAHPITAVSGTNLGMSLKVTGAGGSTNHPAFLPLEYQTIARGPMRTRQVRITANGSPLMGAKVRWMATDSYDFANHDDNEVFRTDEKGLLQTSLPSGPVTLTVSDAQSTSNLGLLASVVHVDVPDQGPVEVVVPPAKPATPIKITVQLPDGSTVPNALVRLRNPLLSYSYANSANSRSAWWNRQLGPDGWFLPVECPYCTIDPPMFVTGADGDLTISVFGGFESLGKVDGDVFYDDGELKQSATFVVGGPSINVRLPMMARLRIVEPDDVPANDWLDIDAEADGEASLAVQIDDWTAGAEEVDATVEPACDLMIEGGLYDPTKDIDQVCEQLPSDEGTTSVTSMGARSAFGCAGRKSGRVSTVSRVLVAVCVKKSTLVRLRASRTLPSQLVCIRVKATRCEMPRSNLVVRGVPNAMRRSAVLGLDVLRREIGRAARGAKVVVATTGSCRLARDVILAGRKRGLCQIFFWQDRSKTKLLRRFALPVN